jgi:hypothetical protein
MMSLPRITAGASQLAAGTLMRLPQRLLTAVKAKVVQALKTVLLRLPPPQNSKRKMRAVPRILRGR